MLQSAIASLGILSSLTMIGSLEVSAGAEPTPKIFLFSTIFPDNIGLQFCTDSVQQGCIHSIFIDGQEVSQTTNPVEAQFIVAGGVYRRFCKLEAGETHPCQFSYMQITSFNASGGAISDFNQARILFRPALTEQPEFRIGSAIVNGEIISFQPAPAGGSTLADITVEAPDVQLADCYGLQFSLEACADVDVARSVVSNRVGVLLTPGIQSVIYPAEVTSPCSGPSDQSGCWVAVLEPESNGFWFDTNASFSGPATSNPTNGAVDFLIGGPHFIVGTDPLTATIEDLNLGRFRFFAPSSYMEKVYGLSPLEANSGNLPIRRMTQPNDDPDRLRVDHRVTYEASRLGGLATVTAVSFSTATLRLERIVTVQRGRPISTSEVFASAGLGTTLGAGPFGLAPGQDFITTPQGLIVFPQIGRFTIDAFYSISPSSTLQRQIQVQVVEANVSNPSLRTASPSAPALPATR